MATKGKRKRSGAKTKTPTMLPAKLMMKSTLFGDGAKGMRLQCFENQEFGVRCTRTLPSRDEEWIIVWMSDETGDEEYDTFEELRAAYNEVIKK